MKVLNFITYLLIASVIAILTVVVLSQVLPTVNEIKAFIEPFTKGV